MPTWGIIVHDVNVRSLGIDKALEDLASVQDKVIKDLLASNVQNTGARGQRLPRLTGFGSHLGKVAS
jgi:hypothetical protein